MVVLLVFIVATLEIFFGRKKKTVGRKIRSIWWKRFQKSAGQISRHRNKSSVPASLATDGKEKNWTSIQNILPFFFFSSFNAMPAKST